MNSLVLGFAGVDNTKLSMVGGKGANLGELCRLAGLYVPGGFCITTQAFKQTIEKEPLVNELVDQLLPLGAKDRDKINKLSHHIREAIEGILIPHEITGEITKHLAGLAKNSSFAVRSSATAEDLPTASFAGQQDTYLNVIGKRNIFKHISKCWASLFNERAIVYRIQNGFDHRKVYLAVVVQKMVAADAAGVLFTADPVSANRKILSIDASLGLGEAVVSGIVNVDNYTVRGEQIIGKKIAVKKLAIHSLPGGGTKQQEVDGEMQAKQTLTDEQILLLAQTGRKIEEHFKQPQDIEWCLAENKFYILQSRPITTMFPIPRVADNKKHVYISVGHQQMMTDPMKPLGLSMFQLTSLRPMYKAAGRLFVDVADDLASPSRRAAVLGMMGKSEPLITGALTTIIERGDFIQMQPDSKETEVAKIIKPSPSSPLQTQLQNDPAIVSNLINQSQTARRELKQKIQSQSGPALFNFILEDIEQLKTSMRVPENMGAIMAAINASAWINEKMNEWLGEKNVADILTLSAPNNITSEMGLELMDVADTIRPYPAVIKYLQQTKDDDFLKGIVNVNGGQQAYNAVIAYLEKYGMRCAGEIDITKTRWSERPVMLVPLILNNIKTFEPVAGKRKFEQGLRLALQKEQEVLDKLKQLPCGEEKVEETKNMIGLVRNFIGYREYPKYNIICRYFIYKQALLKEAEQMVQLGIINDQEDIYYLTFEELQQTAVKKTVDQALINQRKDEHKLFKKLTPPRVMTSDGEIVKGQYIQHNMPANAIAGLPVSPGVVEGRARIILNMHDVDLGDEDILVTTFTDPGWTPLFVSIKGLVTEVGGLMTHGAVIAREYGLPAIVGVENATTLIKDGQLIRLNGTDGYIEIL